MKKILLLDDSLDIVQVVEEVLTYEGFGVHVTLKSTEFLQIAMRYRPDLVLLDYKLADGNGGDLCRTVKAHPELKHIPVVIFSAYVHPGVNLSDFGCDAVITKPFDLEFLLQTVQRLTGLNISTDGEMV